jgi:L-asparaginase
VPIVLASQCSFGHVTLGAYEASAAALQAGALSAVDMTREAALVKLMFLLGQDLAFDTLREVWGRSLAGECTEYVS